MRRRPAILFFLVCGLVFSSGCQSLGTYFKDRGNDFADCFKADVGVMGIGAEAHVRITDAFATGAGVSAALKIGFKGRHIDGWADWHVGLPFSPIYWFTEGENHREFPLTYYCLTGNKAFFCITGTVSCIPGSYEAESVLVYPIAFEKTPERNSPFNMCDIDNNNISEVEKYALMRPQKKPFSGNLLHSFDIEAGGTIGFILCASAHVGFSPGEFADFMLGWFGLDIAGDDTASLKHEKEPAEKSQSEKTVP